MQMKMICNFTSTSEKRCKDDPDGTAWLNGYEEITGLFARHVVCLSYTQLGGRGCISSTECFS